MPAALHIAVFEGDRVLLRDRPWRVRSRSQVAGSATVMELEAQDGELPHLVSVMVPPDEIISLPSETLHFDLNGLDAFGPWARAHQILGATLIGQTGLLSGARFGRVALEAYQLAPTLRLLSKSRPSLLIADDVGLGKTIEAGLALLELLARGRARRVLVVAPPGLLVQWKEELADKFGLDFAVIENASGLARVQTDLPAGISPWDALPFVLTSVDFLKKETVRGRALRKRWDLIIVDEAHSLAESGTPDNPYRTQRTRLGVALRDASRGLLLLTATPHNGYSHSFRSLLDLVEPMAGTFAGDRDKLARRVEAAMVRRMKPQITRIRPDGIREEVFPRRNVSGIPVPLEASEQELLRKVAAYCSKTARSAHETEEADLVTFAMQIVKKRALSSRRALENTIEHRLDALRKEEADALPTAAEIRELQDELPMDEVGAEGTAIRIVRAAVPKEEKRRKAEISALNGIRRLLRSLPTRDPKVESLLQQVRAVLAGDPTAKIIVFTEYLDSVFTISDALEQADDLKGRAVVLRGGLSGGKRRRIQDRFDQPDIALLLATDAASEGLNLQRLCHRVIHFELPWNPNRLEQRNGRVDRYGQKHAPLIRYLYYPDSPEDDVLHRLVGRIESIRDDRVSTPDILGVLSGAGDLSRQLVDLNPDEAGLEAHKSSLIQHFEDRTADFVRNVQPLITAGDGSDVLESQRLLDLLNTAEPLMPDEKELEMLMSDILGPKAVVATTTEGVFRIQVPVRYRGPDVLPVYPRHLSPLCGRPVPSRRGGVHHSTSSPRSVPRS